MIPEAIATSSPYDVAIVGGGISGLSTAYYLQRHAAQAQRPLGYVLIESSSRVGGKIQTDRVDGFGDTPFVVEGGPDSFLTQKPWALQLARELGLQDRLLGTNDHLRKTFILHKGKPMPLPEGVMLIVPTRFEPFVTSPLISPWGKLRMGLELLIPARTNDSDETLAGFVRRRLGEEALDKIAEPLLSGIYNAESEKQSLLATFPRLREVEKKFGSLIRGMVAGRKSVKPQIASTDAAQPSKPLSAFVSFQSGIQELVDTIFPVLTGEMLLGSGVTSIERIDFGTSENPTAGSRGPTLFELKLSNGTTIQAHQVVLAIPAFASAKLLANLAPGASDLLASIRYVSTGTISFGFRRSEVSHPLNGFGLLIPKSENRPVNAFTWSSTKFEKRAPEDFILVRVFFGGSRNPELVERSDDDIVAIARRELHALLGIDATPVFHRLFRWHNATPQYDIGHLDLVDAIENSLPRGILVTGSPFRGIGIPDCVHQAQETAGLLWKELTKVVHSS